MTNRSWAQFAYEFSHEICHVLSGYERMRGSRNSWFHEVLCELASVFTLRRMAEGWPSSPPYPNWSDLRSGQLSTYADNCTSHAKSVDYQRRHDTFRLAAVSRKTACGKICCKRDKNAVVAYTLLPIFESEPAGWNAIRRLPNSSAMFEDYLREWHSLVEPLDKPFVKRILGFFED